MFPVCPLFRNVLFVIICIVFVICIKNSTFDLLNALSNSYVNVERQQTSVIVPRNVSKRKLVLLQMLFRHGHRAPFMLYPTDPNNASFWKEGLGTLTRLGRLQHYRLGYHLQMRYNDFITTNPKEVELISAESSRTQHGAYSFLAGLYSPKEEYRFSKDLNWQPIISKNSQRYKNILTRDHCSKVEVEYRLLKKSQLAKDTRHRFDDLYKFWSVNSGRVIDDWHLANDLGKTFACEKKYNLTIPQWAYEYWDELKIQTGLNYYFHYGTKTLLRYRIGPLIGFMVENMKNRIEERNTEKRVFIYSAHGSYVAQTLMTLGKYNWAEPPPASTIVLELWKEDDKDYSVRWLYFNSSSPEVNVKPPYILNFPECGGEYCPFSQYLEKISIFIPTDYKTECNDSTQFFQPLDLITKPLVGSTSKAQSESIFYIISSLYILLFCSKIINQQINI